MIKNTKLTDRGQSPYSRPECNVLDIKTEGVLCFSPAGLTGEDFTLGQEITDYEQIF